MTATDFREVLLSADFKTGLEELSSYLSSIMQEEPIVHLLANCLWKQKYSYVLERNDRHDLSISGKNVEFKFNYETCATKIENELQKCGGDLAGILAAAQTKRNDRGVLPRIYKDIWEKRPEIFVWIICSRDLSQFSQDVLERIPEAKRLRAYRRTHPFKADAQFLETFDSLLDRFQTLRPFSVITAEIETDGDFRSIYHFRICEFKDP